MPDAPSATAAEATVTRRRQPSTGAASEPAPSAAPRRAATGARHRDERATDAPQATAAGSRPRPLARRIARERGIELAAVARHRPRRADRRRGRRARRRPRRRRPRRGAGAGRDRRGRVDPAHEHPQDDRAPADRGLEVPVFELTVSADMTRANALIERSRELDPDVRVTVTDLLVKVCAQALARHPDVNVQFTDEALLRFPTRERRHRRRGAAGARRPGDPLGRAALARRDRRAPRRRRRPRARAQARSRPTSRRARSRSRTSACSASSSSSRCSTRRRRRSSRSAPPRTGPSSRDGEVVVRPMMTVTLTVDHRAVDGAPAAEFLRTVKALPRGSRARALSDVVIRNGGHLDVPFMRSMLDPRLQLARRTSSTPTSRSRRTSTAGAARATRR